MTQEELLSKISRSVYESIEKNIKNKIRDIYEDGSAEGMYVGIALGRFYERHNIQNGDGIPNELCNEECEVYETAMKEYYAHPRTESLS